MLLESGDLIPVLPEAVDVPWTKRKSQILNFLHRGAVNFKTYVYDTNVGDIAPLTTYFNPEKWTVLDLNQKFGHFADSVCDSKSGSVTLPVATDSDVKSASLQPRLILYPELVRSSVSREEDSIAVPPKRRQLSITEYTFVPSSSRLPSPADSTSSSSGTTATPITDSNVVKSVSLQQPPLILNQEFVRSLMQDPIGPPKRRKLSAAVVPEDLLNFESMMLPSPSETSTTGTAQLITDSKSVSSLLQQPPLILNQDLVRSLGQDPIGPPKRRKLTPTTTTLATEENLFNFESLRLPWLASTTSTWTAPFTETLSPFMLTDNNIWSSAQHDHPDDLDLIDDLDLEEVANEAIRDEELSPRVL